MRRHDKEHRKGLSVSGLAVPYSPSLHKATCSTIMAQLMLILIKQILWILFIYGVTKPLLSNPCQPGEPSGTCYYVTRIKYSRDLKPPFLSGFTPSIESTTPKSQVDNPTLYVGEESGPFLARVQPPKISLICLLQDNRYNSSNKVSKTIEITCPSLYTSFRSY